MIPLLFCILKLINNHSDALRKMSEKLHPKQPHILSELRYLSPSPHLKRETISRRRPVDGPMNLAGVFLPDKNLPWGRRGR